VVRIFVMGLRLRALPSRVELSTDAGPRASSVFWSRRRRGSFDASRQICILRKRDHDGGDGELRVLLNLRHEDEDDDAAGAFSALCSMAREARTTL